MDIHIKLTIDDRFVNFFKNLFRKKNAVKWLMVFLVLCAISLSGSEITKSYHFVENTEINPDEVNANFDDLFAKVNELDGRSWDKSGNDLVYNSGNVGIGAIPETKLQVNGVLSVGGLSGRFANSGKAIELITDTVFGGVHDDHTGIRMFAYDMNGWGTAKLGIQVSNEWRSYYSTPAMIIGQNLARFNGGIIVGAGVKGYSDSSTGVYGESSSDTGVYGTSGSGYGVYGRSDSSYGVLGVSDSSFGVWGISSSNVGVSGSSVSNVGVSGSSVSSYGVMGKSNSSSSYDFYAAGFGVNYGPFTGGHEVILSDDFVEDVKTGMIVSSTGETKIRRDNEGKISISSTLPTVRLSNKINDKTVFGVFVAENSLPEDHWYDTKDGKRFAVVNALGEGRVLVTNINGDIQNGDYITTSNISGYGQKQDDDLLHSYTLGKALETVEWDKVVETISLNGVKYKIYLIAVSYTSG